MSELSMLLLIGVIRVFTSKALLSRNGQVTEKFLFKVLGLTVVYSTLLTLVLVPLVRPAILGADILFNIDRSVEGIIISYLILYALAVFFLELRNNQICLQGAYPNETIFKATLASHILSVVVWIVFMMT